MSEQRLDIVDRAEKVIKALVLSVGPMQGDSNDKNTNQLRKILSAFISVQRKVEIENQTRRIEERIISDDLALEIKMLKATFLYQAVREKQTSKYLKAFLAESKIQEEIEKVGNDYKQFQLLCKYVEALIAFQKYYNSVSVNNSNKNTKHDNYQQKRSGR